MQTLPNLTKPNISELPKNPSLTVSIHLSWHKSKSRIWANKIGNPFGGYDACYFATLELKGIDTTHFELGSYDLYVSLAYKSEIFTAKLGKRLEVAKNGVRSLISN